MKRLRRGSSLLEVMTAGAVLVIGLVGVLQLIIYSASNSRRGGQWVTASFQAQDVLYEFVGGGFGGPGLVAGVYDAGVVTDPDGRIVRRTVTVTDVTAAAAYPAFQVVSEIRWQAGGPASELRLMRAEALISAVP